MREADQLIADALRDIAAEAGRPGPVADAAWRAGRRRRLTVLAASAASIAGAITLAVAVVLPLTATPGAVSPPTPPSALVSITLSPATPASLDVLDRAAQLLAQRAAYLRLPVRVQVAGPDVVLTGPAADETQLKAIAMVGALNFRQVLLYQPYDGTAAAPATYGNASLVNHRTLALFRKLACTPGDTSTWKDQVGYAIAGDYDNPDTQIVSCDSSGGKYALDVASVRGTQIGRAVAVLSRTNNDWAVTLTLKSAGAAAFGALTSELYDRYYSGSQAGNEDDVVLDQVAAVLDGNVMSSPEIDGPIPGGVVQITGAFTRAQAEELAADVQSGPLPADFRVSAISTFTPSASGQAAAG